MLSGNNELSDIVHGWLIFPFFSTRSLLIFPLIILLWLKPIFTRPTGEGSPAAVQKTKNKKIQFFFIDKKK